MIFRKKERTRPGVISFRPRGDGPKPAFARRAGLRGDASRTLSTTSTPRRSDSTPTAKPWTRSGPATALSQGDPPFPSARIRPPSAPGSGRASRMSLGGRARLERQRRSPDTLRDAARRIDPSDGAPEHVSLVPLQAIRCESFRRCAGEFGASEADCRRMAWRPRNSRPHASRSARSAIVSFPVKVDPCSRTN